VPGTSAQVITKYRARNHQMMLLYWNPDFMDPHSNAKAFAYNDDKKAIVTNPQGTKFADIVKAAEKCTAGCLHPGTPWNMSEPGIDKLMARAAKYN